MSVSKCKHRWAVSAECELCEKVVALNWTTKRPTTPGWYWWVGEGGSVSDLEIVKICDYQLAGCNKLQVWRMGMDVESLELFIERNGVGKWAGPLEMPE